MHGVEISHAILREVLGLEQANPGSWRLNELSWRHDRFATSILVEMKSKC